MRWAMVSRNFAVLASRGGRHAEAQRALGRAYDLGKGVDQDNVQSTYWYRKAAEQGNSYAQSSLASCYDIGIGVERNASEAARWYREVIKNGTEQQVEEARRKLKELRD